MELQHYADGAAFLRRARDFLEAHATLNSLLIALAERPACDEPYFATISDGDSVVVAAIRTPPRHLVLSTATKPVTSALRLLAADLRRRQQTLPGATGPTPVVTELSEIWATVAGVTARVRLTFKVFELEAVREPPWPSGDLRLATESDVDLLSSWTHRFIDETGLPEEDRDAASPDVVRQRIARRALHLWTVDGAPVTMAASASRSLAWIGGVYTPSDHRRRGYASACVARLSQTLLRGGSKKVTLSTDATNPTSNKIYEAIGYHHVGGALMMSFTGSQ